ncbi:unnamed protein product [Candidula unifasciata]|uniref:AB hydrolase-1 domain-containing protein n=1 Tax=Candidula unifasciata TaxID=100452 RepID=A0A8S3ZX08_9EUPU|nr:unnamed protein product [Candidula unifasciata]
MSGILERIKLWGLATTYGLLVLLHIIRQCYRKGVGKVFHWKQWERPAILDDPSFGTHGFLTLKDVRIHYVASGPEDKPLMLFVHGFPEFWYSWRHQIREFQKDYRVVAIDMRGYGESSKPSGIENYTVTKLVSDLQQIIPALGYKSCVLVAHDWGGAVAWAFARFNPTLVDKLIVMNVPPSPVFSKVLPTNKYQQKKSWYMFFFQLPFLPELNFKLDDFSLFDELFVSERNSDISKDAKKAAENIVPYKYVFSQPGALTPPINYYRALFRTTRGTYDLDYQMPVLLIWGCKDTALDIALPDAVEKETTKIEVKRIPDASHFVQVDAPEEVNKLMREWLNKQKK